MVEIFCAWAAFYLFLLI
uniref:Uncharacterized protein n=1 Tax=Rhizophora mucronata TaxID=61149 RepID=A0A2P2QXF1_RHIMU